MGHEGLTSRAPIDHSLTAARLFWETGKKKVAAGFGECRTRLLNVAVPVSVMVLFVVGLPLLFLLACAAAQLPPGEEWE